MIKMVDLKFPMAKATFRSYMLTLAWHVLKRFCKFKIYRYFSPNAMSMVTLKHAKLLL